VKPARIMILAGEHSGDRLGAGLAAALRERRPGLVLEGMGGERMREAGVDLLVDSSRLGVTGLVEVFGRLGEYRTALATLKRRLRDDPPDLVVPIDYPDFNLRFARAAREAGLPVVYFVSPQVWAWRRRRLRFIARTVSHILVLFPFEEEFYEEAGVPVTFVGHPLLDRLGSIPARDESRRVLGLPPDDPIVALLPGSRANEVKRILPVMSRAAALVSERVPGVRFVMPVASGLDAEIFEAALEGGPPVIRFGDRYEELVRAASAAAVASGTATLETALLGTPMVAVYRLHPLTYWMGRALVRVDHIAMPNLIVGRQAVPELVQGDLTPEALASELVRLLTDREARGRMEGALAEVRAKLAGPGAFPRAAAAVLDELPTGR